MKKVFLVALMAFSLVATAQKVNFGVKGGLNFSTLNAADSFGDVGYKLGYHVGALAEVMLSEKFAVQPEVLYSSQGASLKSLAGKKIEDASYTVNYVTVPVMAKYYVTPGLSLEAGPQISFKAGSKVKIKNIEVKNQNDKLKSIDFGLGLGAGYKFGEALNFGVRYNLGLTDMVKDNPSKDAVKNGVFQLSVGYMF